METLVPKYQILICFVDLKPDLAFLYNKGHNFWKSVSTWKIPKTEYFQTKSHALVSGQ